MLWSQFSAIFDNFRRKHRSISQKPLLWSQFSAIFDNFRRKNRSISQKPLLWSQFSAIFDNFRRKNRSISQKPLLWSQFWINYLCFGSKMPGLFAEFFGENIFKNHNISPWSVGIIFLSAQKRPQINFLKNRTYIGTHVVDEPLPNQLYSISVARWCVGIPKSQFGYILEGLWMENVRIFYPFGIFTAI
jgi:hypothetical protein